MSQDDNQNTRQFSFTRKGSGDPQGAVTDTLWPIRSIRVRILRDVDGATNAGNVCMTCIKRVVREGDYGRG